MSGKLDTILNLEKNTPPDQSISIYDVLLFFVGFTSLIALILIAVRKFNIPILIGISAGLTIAYVVLGGKKVIVNDPRFTQIPFIFIFILALIFRLGTFTHFKGGQDQGLYVSMSVTLVRNGGVDIYDAFRASLPEDLKRIYDYEDNLANGGRTHLEDAIKSLYQIDFYPLNGVWLAIFGTVLGLGNHGYATQFFSLIVVIGVYLLTLELTNYNKQAAIIAMLFAAMNPAFVFFSKFPVSETVAMAFSVNGFYLIAKAIRCEKKVVRIFLITASVLLLGMYNFIRMSFILFLPTIAVIFISVFLFSDLRKHRLPVSLFVAGVGILFGSSWAYYYFYQPTLVKGIIEHTYVPFLEKSLFVFLGIAILGLVLIWFFIQFKDKVDKVVTLVIEKLKGLSAWFILIILALSIIQVVELCTTGYSPDGATMITGNDIFNIRFSAIYNFMLLISPFAFGLLLMAPFIRIHFSRIQLILLLTIIITWIGLSQTGFYVILYKYYYTRYLTSEMLLYSIILVSILLMYMLNHKGKLKSVAKVIIAGTALFFLLFSTQQIGRAETEDPQIYYDLNRVIGSRDVIVSFLYQDKSFPLRFYFGKNVFQLSTVDSTLNSEVLNRLNENSAYNNIYILSDSPFEGTPVECGLELVQKYNYVFGYYSDSAHGVPSLFVKHVNVFQFLLPVTYMVEKSDVYLYKLVGNTGEIKIINNISINCVDKQN
jgi:hypothetical protein